MLTTRNYANVMDQVLPKLSAVQKEAHDLLSEGSSNFNDFELLDEMMQDADIRETVELYLSQVEKMLEKPAPEPKPKPPKATKEPKPKKEKAPKPSKAAKEPKPKKEKAPKPTKAAKKTKPKAKPSTKKKVEKFDAKKYQMVKKLPVELTFVKRYLKMDNKQVTKAEVRSFIKSIERQNAEGAFTIKGKYGKEVQHIQNELHKIYNDKSIPNTFTFGLDKGDESVLKKYNDLINETKIDFSVQFIKRYLRMLGSETVAKAKKFLTDIGKAEETGKLKASNKNIAYIDTIKRVLGKYADGKTDELEHSKAELQGLQGVLNIEIKHGDAPKKRTTVKKKR